MELTQILNQIEYHLRNFNNKAYRFRLTLLSS